MTSGPKVVPPNDRPVVAHSRVPGEFMLHPITLAALCTLGLNDHYLKAAYGNWLTGKLSDFAGLIFFPLFLLAVLELARAPFSESWRAGKTAVVLSLGGTALIFLAINLYGAAAHLYARSAEQVWLCLGSDGVNAAKVADVTDLLALPCLWIPYFIARRACCPPTLPHARQ